MSSLKTDKDKLKLLKEFLKMSVSICLNKIIV